LGFYKNWITEKHKNQEKKNIFIFYQYSLHLFFEE